MLSKPWLKSEKGVERFLLNHHITYLLEKYPLEDTKKKGDRFLAFLYNYSIIKNISKEIGCRK